MNEHAATITFGAPKLPPAPTVFVVDDDISVRESLEFLIRCAGWVPRIFASARDFLAAPPAPAASCLVLDMSLPGESGLDLQRAIAPRGDVPVIFHTGCNDVRLGINAMKAGAVEFLTKPCPTDALLVAIRDALERSRIAMQEGARLRALREAHAALTPRERDVMRLVVAGLLNKQVGAELGISEITVKAHRGRLMRKMQARSLPHLVRIASELDRYCS